MQTVEDEQTQDGGEYDRVPPASSAQVELEPELGAGTGDLLVRLVVGALAEGTDEALRRLRQWNEEALHRSQQSAALDGDHRLRWLLIGLLLEAQAGVQRQFAEVRQRGTRALYHPGVTLHSMEESMREWLPSSFVRRIDAWRLQGQRRRERWIREGYLAEQEGRYLARHATQAALEELLDYFAQNPQVRALIEQQGLGVADEAVGEVRARAASADTRLEQIAHAILRRTPSSHPPTSAEQAAATLHTSPNSGHGEKAK